MPIWKERVTAEKNSVISYNENYGRITAQICIWLWHGFACGIVGQTKDTNCVIDTRNNANYGVLEVKQNQAGYVHKDDIFVKDC